MGKLSAENRLCSIYIGALTFIALCLIVGQFVVQHTLNTSESDGNRINVAGRQRMLSERIVNLVSQLDRLEYGGVQHHENRANLAFSMQLLRKSHFSLIHGDPEQDLSPTTAVDELSMFQSLESRMNEFLVLADSFLKPIEIEDRNASIFRLEESKQSFLQMMDDLVGRMGHNSNARIGKAKQVEYGILGVTLILLVLEALFVFRPATLEIRRSMQSLREQKKHLQESERRYREIIRHSAGPIILLDLTSGRILEINPAAESDIGEDAEKLIGRRMHAMLDAKNAELLGDHLNRLETEDSSQGELSLALRSGKTRHWSVRFSKHRSETESYVMLNAHDITDRFVREEALRQKSIRDGLTGLLNRDAFDQALVDQINIHENQGTPFTLALIDVDRFKCINDQYGHQAGDSVLRTLAELVRSTCRAADIVARFGGEEIAVIIPALAQQDALRIVDRIRVSLENTEVYFDSEENGLESVCVTVSIGMASVPTDSLAAEDLIARADESLYQAKKEGRNRVVVASQTRQTGSSCALST